jgi:hypothetical protein
MSDSDDSFELEDMGFQRSLEPVSESALDGPDRALFDAVAEMEAAFEEWQKTGAKDEGFDSLDAIEARCYQFIADTPAQTLEGVLLKLRVAADAFSANRPGEPQALVMSALAAVERMLEGTGQIRHPTRRRQPTRRI